MPMMKLGGAGLPVKEVTYIYRPLRESPWARGEILCASSETIRATWRIPLSFLVLFLLPFI